MSNRRFCPGCSEPLLAVAAILSALLCMVTVLVGFEVLIRWVPAMSGSQNATCS